MDRRVCVLAAPPPPPPTPLSLQSYTDGPDVSFDARLVNTSSVRDAFLALVAARFARIGVAATRVAAVAVAVDERRGLYDVRVAWRGGGDGSVVAALLAVNDVPPGDACAAWRADHNVCGAVQDSTTLDVVAVQARADTLPPGVNAALLPFGRRWRGLGVPSSLGVPSTSTAASPLGESKKSDIGWLKDIYSIFDQGASGRWFGAMFFCARGAFDGGGWGASR